MDSGLLERGDDIEEARGKARDVLVPQGHPTCIYKLELPGPPSPRLLLHPAIASACDTERAREKGGEESLGSSGRGKDLVRSM